MREDGSFGLMSLISLRKDMLAAIVACDDLFPSLFLSTSQRQTHTLTRGLKYSLPRCFHSLSLNFC